MFPDFMTTAQDGGKFVTLTHRPPLLPGNAPGTHFCLRLIRPQGLSAIGTIMSMTSSGIEPATFRFVAQHLNHCATAVTCKGIHIYIYIYIYIYVCVCVCVCIYIYIYIYVCVCVCVCTYIYAYRKHILADEYIY